MNLHYKNMKQISQNIQDWTESHLSNLGIFELSYGYYDLKNQLWMGMPSSYPWYCAYLECQYDMQICKRLRTGVNYWNQTSDLYARYKTQLNHHNLNQVYKCDVVIQNGQKFEMLTIACKRKLFGVELRILERALRNLSDQAYEIITNKKNILRELNTLAEAPNIPDQMNLLQLDPFQPKVLATA